MSFSGSDVIRHIFITLFEVGFSSPNSLCAYFCLIFWRSASPWGNLLLLFDPVSKYTKQHQRNYTKFYSPNIIRIFTCIQYVIKSAIEIKQDTLYNVIQTQ